VIIQLRSIGRAEPDDLAAILPVLSEAAAAVDLDHSRIAVVLDWVQYRKNFRAPVMVRPFVGSAREGRGGEPLAEIAIDVRRAGAIDRATLRMEIVDRLSKALGLLPDIHECTHLEDWVRPSKSVTWSFNRSYWRHLGAWDATFEKDYAAALPGGVSDGTSPAFWADRIDAFMALSTVSRSGQSCPRRSTCSSSAWATGRARRCGWTPSRPRARSRDATT
jgi:hypothetical protein